MFDRRLFRCSCGARCRCPPILQIDGARPDVTVDVVIETEHDVWTQMFRARLRCQTFRNARSTLSMRERGWRERGRITVVLSNVTATMP
jgi:hypothetical protein